MTATNPEVSSSTSPAPTARFPYRLLVLLTVGVFLLDQATKLWILHLSGLPHGVYPPEGGIVIIPGFFAIVFATNHGAAWGILQGQSFLLTVVAIAALAVIWLMRRKLELHLPAQQLAFGLLVGGILGNLVDRLAYGYVVDFLDFHLGFYRWPTFNVADSGIVVGLCIYTWLSLRADTRAAAPRVTA